MLRQLTNERIVFLKNSVQGLDDETVAIRRKQYGVNNIVEEQTGEWRELILDTFSDPMLWFLIITSSLFAFVGDFREAVILIVAIVPLAGMDMFLHKRTQASTIGLGKRLAAQANVIRNGRSINIPSNEVVVGDLVLLKYGEPFPADGIITDADEVQVDESVLTGEAFPVHKQSYSVSEGLKGNTATGGIAIDMGHWGFAGTRLLTGKLRMRVMYTGSETYYGEIVRSALQGRHGNTPLQISIYNLVKVLLTAAFVMCLIVALVRWYQGFGVLDAVISALTLAIAALPEEFPVVFTFFLGVGVYRLAKHGALVRRAVAVENIGRVTVICSDKTGTLTQGQLKLTHTYPVSPNSKTDLLRVARLASRQESGDPMDQVILSETSGLEGKRTHLATFPFTEDRKKETAVIHHSDGKLLVVVKGAPEVVLKECCLVKGQFDANMAIVESLASGGHKVIACARKVIDDTESTDHEPQGGFELVGLLALEDPVRPGVKESIQFCRESGIHVIMITGDHPLTTRAVAKELGIGDGDPRIITAEELELQIREDRQISFHEIDAIARSVPAQKLRIVRVLQNNGEIVSVTGDGVNDVPALQAADVGIAMGERGTQAAREVSAIVLLDDNFRTIVRAIAEGIQLFYNLRLSFTYLLLFHIPLVISAAVIPLLGFPLLYLPVHIIWLELIIHPTALLVYQQLPDYRSVSRKNVRSRTWLFSRSEWSLIYLVGILMTCMVVGGYAYSLGMGRNVEHARAMTIAILCCYSALLTAALSRLHSMTSYIIVFGTLLSAFILIQVPIFATYLHLQPLHMNDWLIAATGSGMIVILYFLVFNRMHVRSAVLTGS